MKTKRPEIKQDFMNVNMDISTIRYVSLNKEWQYDNVCSLFTRVYIPTQGEGTLKIGNETVKLTKGNVYIVPAMLNFSYSCEDYLEKLFFHIKLTKGDDFDLLSKVGRCLVLKNKEKEVKKLFDLLGNQSLEAVFETKTILSAIITEAIRENNILLGQAKEYSHITKAALCYIRENLSASLKIADVAKALFTSKPTLQVNFKKEMNRSIGKYIDECVLLESEKELLNNELSIKEISNKLGFCDQFYFSRKFSQRYGVSPQEYRKRKI